MSKADETLIGRIPIRDLRPGLPDRLWPAKAVVGEVVPFSATVFREGHDRLAVDALLTSPSGGTRRIPLALTAPGTDRWSAEVLLDEPGDWSWRIEASGDDWSTWRHNAEVKIGAGVDEALMIQMGRDLLVRSAKGNRRRSVLTQALSAINDDAVSARQRLATITAAEVEAAVAQNPPRSLTTLSDPVPLRVERERAGVGAWYEFFPRSEGAVRDADGAWTSGTFRTAAKRLPAVKAMGFDVLYLPPIHPIGRTNRKGPNNTLTAGPGDPGSPWAIGAAEGGHDTVHPDLGTIKDFRAFVAAAHDEGLEVALDFALQASPDHPWVQQHPDWFTTLPDGTIAFAENPPKKYQDIYPINFDLDPDGLCDEVVRLLEQWIDCGVKIFRVDNPHTKPLWFWEWVLGDIRSRHADVVFLAEAFTRPAMMQSLAGAGFQQSYTYFAWRNTKKELEEYLTEVSHETADWFRPNFWVNTPDILTEYLQFGGVAAYKIRAALAATGAPSWGMYAGYELIESVARPGSEENIDNEKYEYKARDWERAEREGTSIAPYITSLNAIRRAHPAIRQLRATRIHWSDDEAILVFSKHLDGRFTTTGVADTVIVVANVDPHSERSTTVHLDLEALGLPADRRFTVVDELTGARYEWGADNYVKLNAFVNPVHILRVERNQP